MPAERQSSRVQIESSAMNYFGRGMFRTAVWRVGKFVDTAHNSGYDGLQWHPVKNIRAGRQLRRGNITQSDKDAFSSASQSWRNEKTLKEAWKHPNRPLAMVSYFLLPERTASLDDIAHVQQVVGRDLPVVFQPAATDTRADTGVDRNFGEKLIQPTAELMAQWNVSTPLELYREAKKRGYTGFALDLHLLRIPFKDKNLSDWVDTLPQLLPFTKEVQIGAGRSDIMQPHTIDSQQELQDLLNGGGNSELMHMLRLLDVYDYHGRVVTEIPVESLRAFRRNKGEKWSKQGLIEDHTRIVTTIQNILG